MKVDNRMERLCAAVAPVPGSLPVHQAAGLHDGKHFPPGKREGTGMVYGWTRVEDYLTGWVYKVCHPIANSTSTWATSTLKNIDRGYTVA